MLKILTRILPPLPVLYFSLAPLLSFLAYGLYRRRIVQDNLRRAFPDVDEKTRRQLCRRFYFYFGRWMTEIIKGPALSEAEIRRRVTLKGLEHIRESSDAGHSVVLLAGHHCNIEWLVFAFSLEFKDLTALARPLHSPTWWRFLSTSRQRFGLRQVVEKELPQKLRHWKKSRVTLAAVADQRPARSYPKHWIIHFGSETAFQPFINKLPRILDCKVLFLHVREEHNGRYRATVKPLASPPYKKGAIDVLPAYSAALEQMIREQPECFLWTMRRWKYPRPAGEALLKPAAPIDSLS